MSSVRKLRVPYYLSFVSPLPWCSDLALSFNKLKYVLIEEISRARDIRMLPTLSTRAAPIYTVVLPPQDVEWNGELGVWFETDWGRERSIIVKGTKEGSFARLELFSNDCNNARVEEITIWNSLHFAVFIPTLLSGMSYCSSMTNL